MLKKIKKIYEDVVSVPGKTLLSGKESEMETQILLKEVLMKRV